MLTVVDDVSVEHFVENFLFPDWSDVEYFYKDVTALITLSCLCDLTLFISAALNNN